MTEFEKIAYAKSFIDKLANGINPLDDTPIPNDDIANNVRLSRCFFYVSTILQKEIDRERRKATKEKKPERLPFSITPEQRQQFEYSPYPISVSAMGRKINWLVREEIEEKRMEKFSYQKINYWLRDIGMIEWREWGNGKKKRFPTPEGEAIGLILQFWENYGRKSPVIYLSEEAQHFIIDNIEAVMAAEKGSISPLQEDDDEKAVVDEELERTPTLDHLEAVAATEVKKSVNDYVISYNSSEKYEKIQIDSDKNPSIPEQKSKENNQEEPKKEQKLCRNCRFQLSGECSSWEPCDDFQPIYRVSQSEMDNWPTEGDATRFKQKWKKGDWSRN